METTEDILDVMDKHQLKALLTRCWMTHDAMWFMNAVNEVGIEKANVMNRGAVRQMAAVEAKRVMRAAGVDGVRDLAGMRRFVEAAAQLVIGDFIEFSVEWSEADSSMCFRIPKCFAHDGVAMLGVLDRYECGIYERIYGWCDALDVEYEVTPDTLRCIFDDTGVCVRTMRFTFPTG